MYANTNRAYLHARVCPYKPNSKLAVRQQVPWQCLVETQDRLGGAESVDHGQTQRNNKPLGSPSLPHAITHTRTPRHVLDGDIAAAKMKKMTTTSLWGRGRNHDRCYRYNRICCADGDQSSDSKPEPESPEPPSLLPNRPASSPSPSTSSSSKNAASYSGPPGP